MVSSARPKIANYHFTTLEPALGVVNPKHGKAFVIADIPGIIEGASSGVGLGLKFLKHIERTRLLLHVIDISGSEGRNPLNDFILTNLELKKYSEKLANKIQIVVANKMDSLNEESDLLELEKECKKQRIKLFKISAATNQGLDELMEYVSKTLETIPEEAVVEVEEDDFEIEFVDQEWNIEKVDNVYKITGAPLERLMSKVNIFDIESRQYMQRILKNLGVMAKTSENGIKKWRYIRYCWISI